MVFNMKLFLLALLAAAAVAGRIVKREEGVGNAAQEDIVPPHDWHVRLDDPVEIDVSFDPTGNVAGNQDNDDEDVADPMVEGDLVEKRSSFSFGSSSSFDGDRRKRSFSSSASSLSSDGVDGKRSVVPALLDETDFVDEKILKGDMPGLPKVSSHWVEPDANSKLPPYGWSEGFKIPDNDDAPADEDDEDDVKKTAEDVGKRIISGQRANYGEHPYICSLQRWSNGVWYHTCGSVIYNTNTIMTAAHCVSSRTPSTLRVKCGEFRLRRTDNFEQVMSVQTIKVHPNWTSDGSRGFPNDLALLELTSPLTFDNYVSTLPVDDGTTALNEKCVIVGWGLTERSNRLPSRIRDVTIRRLTNEECTRRWGSNLVNDGHICFKDNDYDGACNGDSGGPAVCNNLLVGVTSYGIRGCISTYYPSVYTRLSYFNAWIVANAF